MGGGERIVGDCLLPPNDQQKCQLCPPTLPYQSHSPPCSKEQRDRFRLSTGGVQLLAPPQDSCPVLLLRDAPPPPLLPPGAATPPGPGLLRPLPPPPLPAKPLAAAAFAAADSGEKKCRCPARVSTRCPRCHRLQLLSQRSIVPCLQGGNEQALRMRTLLSRRQ